MVHPNTVHLAPGALLTWFRTMCGTGTRGCLTPSLAALAAQVMHIALRAHHARVIDLFREVS